MTPRAEKKAKRADVREYVYDYGKPTPPEGYYPSLVPSLGLVTKRTQFQRDDGKWVVRWESTYI